TAALDVPKAGANGMIVNEGGRFWGYGLYLVKGKPTFTYNLFGLKRTRWEGPELAIGRLRHFRVRQREARDPPWQAVRRDDQPAHLRAAVGEERILGVDRRPEVPARHFQPPTSVRARLVSCRRDSPEGGPPLHQGHPRSILWLPCRGPRAGRAATRHRPD